MVNPDFAIVYACIVNSILVGIKAVIDLLRIEVGNDNRCHYAPCLMFTVVCSPLSVVDARIIFPFYL